MLQDIIKRRYSARNFENVEVEQNKVQYILDCALSAPSKQSVYPYKIFVLGNSKRANKFKNWLFWNDTWCVDGKRADPSQMDSKEKRFNGQYKAPLLFLYAHRTPKDLVHTPLTVLNNNLDYNLVDMTVSASFAMLAAEEQGLRTCFGRCHSYEYVDSILGKGSIKIGLALGMGYAKSVTNKSDMRISITNKKNILQGYDTNNLEQTYPIKKHNVRQNKPDINELFTFI